MCCCRCRCCCIWNMSIFSSFTRIHIHIQLSHYDKSNWQIAILIFYCLWPPKKKPFPSNLFHRIELLHVYEYMNRIDLQIPNSSCILTSELASICFFLYISFDFSRFLFNFLQLITEYLFPLLTLWNLAHHWCIPFFSQQRRKFTLIVYQFCEILFSKIKFTLLFTFWLKSELFCGQLLCSFFCIDWITLTFFLSLVRSLLRKLLIAGVIMK